MTKWISAEYTISNAGWLRVLDGVCAVGYLPAGRYNPLSKTANERIMRCSCMDGSSECDEIDATAFDRKVVRGLIVAAGGKHIRVRMRGK